MEAFERAFDHVPLGLYDEDRKPAERALGELLAELVAAERKLESAITLYEAKLEDQERRANTLAEVAEAARMVRESDWFMVRSEGAAKALIDALDDL